MKCNFPPFRENFDKPTHLQTDQQTDIRGHREVTLPIMIVVVRERRGPARVDWGVGGEWGGAV